MGLKVTASFAVRPKGRWRLVIGAGLFLLAVGCGHRRESLRPMFTIPRAVPPPCTDCGGSPAVISEPAGPPSGPFGSEGAIDAPLGGTESTVPLLEAPAESTRSSERRPVAEPAPKASIGEEPEGLDVIPSQSTRDQKRRSPASPSSLKAPALQGPAASIPTLRSGRSQPANDTATRRVRLASMPERLRPFLGDQGGNELFYPSKADRPWKYIVLHHSASPTGNYDQINAEHRKVLGFDGCGYHFVIGNGSGSGDGEIEVAQRWVQQKHGVHCRNAKNAEIDEYGIGICLVGDLERQAPTPRQLEATRLLIAYLSARYEIPRDRINTHAHVAATPTVCPGKHLTINTLLAFQSPEQTAQNAPRVASTSWRVSRGPAANPR